MTIQEFAVIVETMRVAQNRYFGSRSSANLRIAKRFEKQVDLACHEILRGSPTFPSMEVNDVGPEPQGR